MKEKISKAGYKQGDMSTHTADYQTPMAAYSQKDSNKTTEYVERQDKQQSASGKQISKQAYKGRYS